MNDKVLNLPITTRDEIVADKAFPLRLYCMMMLESNCNLEEDHRYIYDHKIRDFEFQDSLRKMKMSESTFNRHMKRLRSYKKVMKMVQGERHVIYRLYYKDKEGRNYVTVPADTLRTLLENVNDTALRVYLVLLYVLLDKKEQKYVEKMVTIEYLANKLGMSLNSRRVISDALKCLAQEGFIDVRKENAMSSVINKNKNVTCCLKSFNYVSLIQSNSNVYEVL